MESQTSIPGTGTSNSTVIIVNKQKSAGTAFFLAFLFGPLGLLYASITGGIIMLIVGIIISILLPIIGTILCWIVCIIWALVAAQKSGTSSISNVTINRN